MELNLNFWKSGNQRAPHKPLLLLFAIGKWSKGKRSFPWLEVEEKVSRLIKLFGGNAKPNVHYPFIRLCNDYDGKIWVVDGELVLGKNGDASLLSLRKHNNIAKFHPDFEKIISIDKEFNKIVSQLIVDNFSPTQFHDILQECELSFADFTLSHGKRRNSEFRQSILDAYGHKCAICDYDIQFRTIIIGVEAAHIQWYNANGPDIVQNGIALCSIHHKLMDYGAIGLNNQFELIAAKGLNGTRDQLDNLIYQFEGKRISLPRSSSDYPGISFLAWQRDEIFKGNKKGV